MDVDKYQNALGFVTNSRLEIVMRTVLLSELQRIEAAIYATTSVVKLDELAAIYEVVKQELAETV